MDYDPSICCGCITYLTNNSRLHLEPTGRQQTKILTGSIWLNPIRCTGANAQTDVAKNTHWQYGWPRARCPQSNVVTGDHARGGGWLFACTALIPG